MTLPAQDIVERREWLIRKDGYFYRPNCQGYTTRKIEAGRYTKTKADAEAAVEPWHMSAVHQDDIPDEPVVADLNAKISRLTADNEALRKGRDTCAEAAKMAAKIGLEQLAEVAALKARVGRLRKQLLRHGAHARDCERPRGPECDCGWGDLRAALANEEAGR